MDTTPPQLPPHTVALILALISSPDEPLPSHLLSTPLKKRQHFLALDPSQDLAAYLAWPDNDPLVNAHLSLALSTLPPPTDADPLASYDIRYLHTGDAIYAHACVSSSLRLVFKWDPAADDAAPSDGWKYHDAKLMPFPPGSSPSPNFDHSRTNPQGPTPTLNVNEQDPSRSITARESQAHHILNDGDVQEDDYWNSYGGGSDDEGGVEGGSQSQHDDSEDAYWAQYSSVQGTADSTRPSPLPQRRKLHNHSDALPGPSNVAQPTRPSLHPFFSSALDEISLQPATDSHYQSILHPATHHRLHNPHHNDPEPSHQDHSSLLLQEPPDDLLGLSFPAVETQRQFSTHVRARRSSSADSHSVSPHDLAARLELLSSCNHSPTVLPVSSSFPPSPPPVTSHITDFPSDANTHVPIPTSQPDLRIDRDFHSISDNPDHRPVQIPNINRASTPAEGEAGGGESPRTNSDDGRTLASISSPPSIRKKAASAHGRERGRTGKGEDDDSLRSAVRGLYNLWISSSTGMSLDNGSERKEIFLHIVRDALDSLEDKGL